MKARVAAAIVLALAACKRKSAEHAPPADATPIDAAVPWVAPVAVLDNVEIELHGAAEGAVVSREIGRQLARCLIEHGDDVVALDAQADPMRRLVHAHLQVQLDAKTARDGAEMMVGFAAGLRWLDEDALPMPTANLVGNATIRDHRPDTAVLAVTEELRVAVCDVLAARLDQLSADDVTAELADPDPEAVAWTLEVIAARRPPGVVDAVIALLDRPAPIGDAAITALVALRDPRAVTALTDRVDMSDRDKLTTVIEAVIAIGGSDAEDFLRVLTAHANPEVAAHAREGLTRLQKRAP